MPANAHSINPSHRYVTTAIPYVNARPHIGFALEVVQADVIARSHRSAGADTRFLAGTDENSIKNVQAAEAAGLPVETLVERNSDHFRALQQGLNLSYDDFIRTSSDPRHAPGARKLWAACFRSGDIYKRAYRGLYCNGCEQFYKAEELADGKCPEHGTVPDFVEEENWFFRLSRYEETLRRLYERREIDVVPESRRNEVLAWIRGGLEDFSISRSAIRARGWGIPVPNDPGQVIYVWFDALANYITALGYGTDEALFRRFWLESDSREHVIGKGITRFHAIYWPAILLSAGIIPPTRIFVHGYVTVDGRKIGKSAGNAIDPVPLAGELGTDALRYYLLRHIRPTGDGDFSHERFRQAHDSELADQLGNLVHRALSMIDRYCGGIIPAPEGTDIRGDDLLHQAADLRKIVAGSIEAYTFDEALDAVWSFVASTNRYVAEQQPWALAKAEGSEPAIRLRNCLFNLEASLQAIADCLSPLLPETSEKLRYKLGGPLRGVEARELAGLKVDRGGALFPKGSISRNPG
ncbi:methionine--tRNA ligase [Neorhizobium petrolearium]|uniref:methionine--tRNA ligase n=1 Tax=Neorhizobium petrolearium TaxID=515361 RepID=A0ABY8M300_9HYPH|nr:class I tRNA ligase family protein [Neorhizobium petrolearium]MCC2608666.1 class I tRNA ligase family protein [Neorhizobium petrolearium]WGI68926.1 class I tRNA ligase family protein [Neorhizobium petrolearium]